MIDKTVDSTQDINSTASPQSTGTTNGASDSSQFQQSADASELNTSRAVDVTETGQPINMSSDTSMSSNDWWLAFAILAVIIIFVLVLKWLVGYPTKSKDSKPSTKKVAAKTPKRKK